MSDQKRRGGRARAGATSHSFGRRFVAWVALGPRQALPLLGLMLALALSATGCAKGTFLEVRFVGMTALEIQAIRVELALMPADGGVIQHSTDTVRPGGGIKLPTSMAFKLDTETGNLQVKATALGPANVELASDSAVTAIRPGETWVITLRFGLAANTDTPEDNGT